MTCVKCPYACQNCTGGGVNQCISCDASNFRIVSIPNSCPCMNGYYNSGSNPICLKCHYSCLQCSTFSTACTACNPFDLRSLSANKCPCDQGFFDDGLELCKPCYNTCTKCDGAGPEDCTGCLNTPTRNL